MLPVLIGAVIGAVAYSCLTDDDSSDKSSTCVEENEAREAEINLETSAEILKDLVLSARKVLFQKREDALARGDMKKVREMDEKLNVMEEYLDQASQIAADVMEKFKEEKTLQKRKKEPATGTALSENETDGNARPDVIENVYVSGKTVPADQFVEAIREVLTERMKKKQEQPDG